MMHTCTLRYMYMYNVDCILLCPDDNSAFKLLSVSVLCYSVLVYFKYYLLGDGLNKHWAKKIQRLSGHVLICRYNVFL